MPCHQSLLDTGDNFKVFGGALLVQSYRQDQGYLRTERTCSTEISGRKSIPKSLMNGQWWYRLPEKPAETRHASSFRNSRHWDRNWSGRVLGHYHEQFVMKQKLFPHVH